jgi:hypothetical protein
VPTKKQQRRRVKQRRHEWEIVEIDEEGNETVVDTRASRDDDSVPASPAKAGKATRGSGRTVLAPSWKRSARRAAIFAPILVLVIFAFDKKTPVASKVAIGVFYSVMMVPFLYYMDRTFYRAQQRRAARERAKPKR